ncbi:uncharacterized protein [Diadema antillarum]|uniref:uncharacterized protein n=1 Tax=Diadema antillarum TaxID=105358 RepID=UPI003A888B6A
MAAPIVSSDASQSDHVGGENVARSTETSDTSRRTKAPSTRSDLLNIKSGDICMESLLIKRSRPYKMGPSSVLNRVKSFLPELERANQQLDARLEKGSTPEDLDIENVDECSGPIIEMNLALCEREDGSSDDDDDDSDADSESDDSEDECHLHHNSAEINPQTLKLPGSRKSKSGRTLIQEMEGSKSNSTSDCQQERT